MKKPQKTSKTAEKKIEGQVKYNHLKIEKKWSKEWEKNNLNKTGDADKKPKCYVLDMFPYPSGEGLHVGHVEGYTATDIYSRYKRMSGFSVLHPMGWDAFGLPAENYAIKNKVNPMVSTKKNVDNFRRQLKMIGFSYDWDREVDTTDPEYYKWTQWIFLQLYKKGLAYESFEPINWCPSCQTGLANEDLEDGKCERCGSEVEKKPMRQWVLKITNYADRLLTDLDGLNWPESVKESQRNWIGRSEGAEIDFIVAKKFNYVLLHGFKSSSQLCFFPWLKSELEKRGHRVTALDLPDPYLPQIDQQVDYVLQNAKFDANTILIGHSLGTVVAMKILERLESPIAKTVLVSGLIEPDVKEKNMALPLKIFFNWKFDTAKIKANAGEIKILQDLTDTVIGDNQPAVIHKNLGGELIQFEAEKPHTCGRVEPVVLDHALERLKIFTTRPDTLFGATYMVVAPEHKIVNRFAEDIQNMDEVKKYVIATAKKTEMERTAEGREKTGVLLKGLEVVNPANGEHLPVFVADYVLPDYGFGAIMAVPAHDERDWAFAKKFNLPIKTVIWNRAILGEPNERVVEDASQSVYIGDGLLINSDKFNGLANDKAKIQITKFVRGHIVTKYKLREWVFSRQRYWGEPIPMIHCAKCGVVPVPEKDLPVTLPKVKSYAPTGTGESPLADIDKWVNVKCPVCVDKAKRETNTMPQWAGSSWYYLRFIDPKNKKVLGDKKKMDQWLPVDMYVGGVEHATRHLIYARFWHKFLFDLGVVGAPEPFQQLKNQGLILGEDSRKMSKRWGNVINPDDMVKLYGADTLRLYEMFMGPFEMSKSWSTENMIGCRRFVERVWRATEKVEKSGEAPELESELHKAIKKVSADIESFSFNTAISTMMIFANFLEKAPVIPQAIMLDFLTLLAPFTPFLAEELWLKLGGKKSVHQALWPVFDEKKIKAEGLTMVVSVNGRVRDSFKVEPGMGEEEAKKIALSLPTIQKWTNDKKIIRIIYVPNKLINIVLD
ncbi:MAG: leucine--tRNA ligase [Candidatus Paceibacterota bacterium]|jgi:leucyl-tRNA synthetase